MVEQKTQTRVGSLVELAGSTVMKERFCGALMAGNGCFPDVGSIAFDTTNIPDQARSLCMWNSRSGWNHSVQRSSVHQQLSLAILRCIPQNRHDYVACKARTSGAQ